MNQQEKEQKIAYYLYKKGAKPNSWISVQTEKAASGTEIALLEISSMFGNSKYFEFTKGTTVVGLVLTREGIDFVENKQKRIIDSLIKWGTFVAAIISAIFGMIQFY